MLGFHKEDDGYENYVSDATGYGTNYGLNLYKGDGLVNSTGLAGAVFKLFEADEVDADGNIISGSPVKNDDGSDYTVTTSDGRDGSAVGTGSPRNGTTCWRLSRLRDMRWTIQSTALSFPRTAT